MTQVFSGYGASSTVQQSNIRQQQQPPRNQPFHSVGQGRMQGDQNRGVQGYGPAHGVQGTTRNEPYYDGNRFNQSLADALRNERQPFLNNQQGSAQRGTTGRSVHGGLGYTDPAGPPQNSTTMRNNTFSYPTQVDGNFATAMSRVAWDPTSAESGNGFNNNNLQRNLYDQVQLALAVQLGLNGPQLVKQRALSNVLTSRPARGDIQQILQSRAELYGDSLDPN